MDDAEEKLSQVQLFLADEPAALFFLCLRPVHQDSHRANTMNSMVWNEWGGGIFSQMVLTSIWTQLTAKNKAGWSSRHLATANHLKSYSQNHIYASTAIEFHFSAIFNVNFTSVGAANLTWSHFYSATGETNSSVPLISLHNLTLVQVAK